MTVDVGDVLAQTARGGAGVELGLDHDGAETMCSPPENRSIDDTSALRQHALVTVVLASSAFTCAVIAIRPLLMSFSPAPRR